MVLILTKIFLLICLLCWSEAFDRNIENVKILVKRQSNDYFDGIETTTRKLIKKCPTNAAGKILKCKKKKKKTTTAKPFGIPPSWARMGGFGINPIGFANISRPSTRNESTTSKAFQTASIPIVSTVLSTSTSATKTVLTLSNSSSLNTSLQSSPFGSLALARVSSVAMQTKSPENTTNATQMHFPSRINPSQAILGGLLIKSLENSTSYPTKPSLLADPIIGNKRSSVNSIAADLYSSASSTTMGYSLSNLSTNIFNRALPSALAQIPPSLISYNSINPVATANLSALRPAIMPVPPLLPTTNKYLSKNASATKTSEIFTLSTNKPAIVNSTKKLIESSIVSSQLSNSSTVTIFNVKNSTTEFTNTNTTSSMTTTGNGMKTSISTSRNDNLTSTVSHARTTITYQGKRTTKRNANRKPPKNKKRRKTTSKIDKLKPKTITTKRTKDENNRDTKNTKIKV